ncbi:MULTISPECIES: hypothetical protein [Rhodococcus]|uniref:Uncharacterized protein n=1 Tax=Rhodococcus jostii (strain RHA1) TaxID=101510 RepID=Q0RWQ9_RHOJR|nr:MULTISPECIES: hypothetical protein [Rhodococcus]ABH00277.1 conserved hypothetical protein [Rhodococcus jostii RHA1]
MREREKLLKNAPDALEGLDDTQRARASYVAKMILAASVGLFDAALNYLWNETINELRARVASFDVAYFFDLAEPDPARRSSLKNPEDLARIDDAKLMEAANRIKLISDIGYKQLDHIRYMRNNASAAHPNQNALTGLKLAEWLETCIREVITLPRDNVVAEIGRLLHNVRTLRLPEAELDNAATFFDQLPQDQADNLAAGLFGIFNPPDATPDTQDNVRNLWPALWPYVSENARNECGIKLSRFRANADLDRAQRARDLLDLVDGAAYLPESDRAAEVAQSLDELNNAHEGWNNFYEEPSVAQRLLDLVGRYGQVPAQLSPRYVNQIVYVFLTNGKGVAWNADPIYVSLIGKFDGVQAALALRSFTDTRISSRLQHELARAKWEELLDLVGPKLTGRRDRALLDSIRGFTGTPDQLILDTAIKRQVNPDTARPRKKARTNGR